MYRRTLLALLATSALVPAWATVDDSTLPSLIVLDFDLLEEHHNPSGQEALQRRLHQAHVQLQHALQEQGLYRVLDLAPAQALLTTLRNQQEYMHRCSDCARQLGEQVKADLVMTTWVQKVSELILNINVEIHHVARQQVLLSKSVDLRGNTDTSWQRGIRFLVRDMVEKRKSNPNYGR